MYSSTWLDLATAQIHFTPDREAVKKELADHLEDRRDAFRALGMDYPEAEQAATAAMGDPEEIAAELGRLHRPWWGYLWTASRWVLLVTAVFFALTAWDGTIERLVPDRENNCPPALPEESVRYNTHTAYLKGSWTPDGSARLGIYDFTVPLAYLQEQVWDDPEQPNTYLLTIYLASHTWRFWDGDSRPVFGTSTDSSGTSYPFDGRGYNSPEGPELRDYFHYQDGRKSGYILEFWIPGPAAPDWLNIPVGYGDEVLHLDLRNEVVR